MNQIKQHTSFFASTTSAVFSGKMHLQIDSLNSHQLIVKFVRDDPSAGNSTSDLDHMLHRRSVQKLLCMQQKVALKHLSLCHCVFNLSLFNLQLSLIFRGGFPSNV